MTARFAGWRRWARILTAVAFLVGVLSARQLALPGGASACSCAGAPAITGREQAVFIGTAGQPQPNGTFRFAVERWFVGGNAAAIDVMSEKQVFPDGSTAVDTCGLHFEVGDRLILVARFAEGVYHPDTCSPHAAVASEEGQELVAAAIDRFGEGAQPGGPPPGVSDAAPPLDLAAIALAGIGVVVVLAVVILLVSVRRGSRHEAGS